MHSVSDLTTFSRKTSGDVPPKLVVRIIASAPCVTPSISHLCFTGRIDHRGRRQGLSLRGHSFHPFLGSFNLTARPREVVS
jgi:hypothetical protein